MRIIFWIFSIISALATLFAVNIYFSVYLNPGPEGMVMIFFLPLIVIAAISIIIAFMIHRSIKKNK